jgi:hypothetical protein
MSSSLSGYFLFWLMSSFFYHDTTTSTPCDHSEEEGLSDGLDSKDKFLWSVNARDTSKRWLPGKEKLFLEKI